MIGRWTIQDGSGSQNEIQQITVNATGGTWMLDLLGGSSFYDPLAWNIAADTLRDYIFAVLDGWYDEVSVTKVGNVYTVEFVNHGGLMDWAQMTADGSGLTTGDEPAGAEYVGFYMSEDATHKPKLEVTFGNAATAQQITGVGAIASEETFGATVVTGTGDQVISDVGAIASEEALGAISVGPVFDPVAITLGLTGRVGAIASRLGSLVLGRPNATAGPINPPAPPPVTVAGVPALTVLIDGLGGATGVDVSSSVLSDSVSWTRGRSADFSAEATGQAQFTLRNDDARYVDGDLLPGMPVRLYATLEGLNYPLFYGYIERVAPEPHTKTIGITCYDVLRRFGEIADASVRMSGRAGTWTTAGGSARDYRVELLTHAERGNLNLCLNGDCADDAGGWDATTISGSTLTRITDDYPTGSASTTCAEWTTSAQYGRLFIPCRTTPTAAGETYTLSFWARTTDATTCYLQVGLSQDQGITDWVPETVTLTTAWTRHVMRYTAVAGNDWQPYLRATFYAGGPLSSTWTGSNTYPMSVRIGDVMVVRGTVDRTYAQGTGRWNNLLSPGSFEADGTTPQGWYPGWRNLITNGSFETDTAGWTGNIARTLPGIYGHPSAGTVVGSYVLDVYKPGDYGHVDQTPATASFNLSGTTFKAGTVYYFGWTYRASVQSDPTRGGPQLLRLGSASVPTDSGYCDLWNYPAPYGTWTPTADRTDAAFVVLCATDYHAQIDGLWVMEGMHTEYGDGPAGVTAPTSYLVSTAQAKYGAKSMAVVTPATANAGVVFSPNPNGLYLIAGHPYTLSMWLYCTSAMPYRVGLGAMNSGVWTEQDATGTTTAATWTRVTVPLVWTTDLVADSRALFATLVYVMQTDATARTFYVDGMRLNPGEADDYEMPQWDLAVESDAFGVGVVLPAANVLAGLNTLNELTLSRHWIQPTMTPPWYTYRTRDRAALVAKASSETYDDDLSDMTSAELDRSAIINSIAIDWISGTEHYSDSDSIDQYGLRPGPAINGATMLPDTTIPDAVGPAIIARYKDPRARPAITVVNRFPSQLQRELDDLVTITFARLGIVGGKYLVMALTTSLGMAGNEWTTTYQLEEYD